MLTPMPMAAAVMRPSEIGRHLLDHIFDHRQRVERGPGGEGSVRLRLLPAGGDVRLELLLEPAMALLGPLAECDQVLLQTRDRIPERPGAPLLLGTVAR